MPSSSPSSTPVRIARIITRLNIGGPAIQAARLSTALDAHGFSTVLFHGRLGEGEGDMSYLVGPEADARFLPTLCRPLSPLDDLRTWWRLFREFHRLQPRIVHTHMAKAGLLGRLAAAAYNLTRGQASAARVVHTYHGHVLEGYFSPWLTQTFVALERGLAGLSDRLIAISPAIQQELLVIHGIGRDDQYRIVPLGFDLDRFAAIDDEARLAARSTLNIPQGAPVVATVGRLTAIKQHGLFLDVIRQVAASHPGVVALIVGDGELRAPLEAQAVAAGIAGNVRFLGWRRDLDTIYAAADVFLLTSRNEGTPVALIEAMASATPGVSTNVGGVPDVISGPETGRVARFGDVAALAGAIHELLADPALRRAIGARARQHVLDHYDLNRLVADVTSLYAELLAER